MTPATPIPYRSAPSPLWRSSVGRLIQCRDHVLLAAAFALSAESAVGGTFSTDFNADLPPDTAVYGNALVDASGGIGDSGALKLTTSNGQAGFYVINDFDAGALVGGFTATFKARLGSGNNAPLHGDGFSFNFASDVPDGPYGRGEEGVGSGLRVSFDSFNNGGGEAPAVEVWFQNQIIATKRVTFLLTGPNFVDVRIHVDRDGTLDVSYAGNAVFENLLCYSPVAGRFSFGANASATRFVGDPIDMHWIDDLTIVTEPLAKPFLRSFRPQGVAVSPDAVLALELQDFGGAINSASIQLRFDDALVVPTVSKAGELTTITFDPPGLLGPGTTHKVQLSYSDNANPPTTSSVQYEFTTYSYVNIPPGFAVPANAVDVNLPGFLIRTHQIGVHRGTSVERAELQLTDKLINPQDQMPFFNVADLSQANADGFFEIDGNLNFASDGLERGLFLGDLQTPGVRPVGNRDNYALEILTYLNLPAGVHTFGIGEVRNYNTTADGSERESGFRLTAGQNPRDLFAPEIAVFDKSRPEGQKIFSVLVEQAGIYPFRLLWFSGIGISGLEWYSINSDGQAVLVNDVWAGGIQSYRQALITRPYVQYTTSPRPNERNVSGEAVIEASIVDGSVAVRGDSIELRLNGARVTPAILGGSPLTTVSYDPPGNLPSGSTNTVQLTFVDANNVSATRTWTFVVEGTIDDPGLLVIEAERFDSKSEASGHTWEPTTANAGFSGDGAMEALPNVNLNVNIDTTISPRLDYFIEFNLPGTYYVWVRGLADSSPGPGQNDSVNVGIDGTLPATSDRIGFFPQGAGYVWSSRTLDGNTRATFTVPTPGRHQVNVWMREDGFIIDKIVLTTNPEFVPTGVGPVEKPVLVVVEAERFDGTAEANNHKWELTTANAGYSGDGAMEATPNVNLNVNINTAASPRLDYNIEIIKPGTYYVWVRGLADSSPGLGQNDSVNVGINGALPATSDRIGFFPQGAGYVWSSTT
ncbi:MAG: hypothetical protein FJ405_15375, partial [Verrucomicrobia bacterium]|nr:hypothetical protein [Verrucomicrobiota bacterium]